MNIRELLESAARKLVSQPQARREAEILLGHALEVNRSFLYANPDMELPHRRRSQFQQLVLQRSRGMPIAYLTGKRAFWSLDLRVTPAVLIPRSETELLVEKALELIPPGAQLRIADLGTGSGAIALSLAKERMNCEFHATDCNIDAMQVAEENARLNGLDRVLFHVGSWTQPLSGKFDLIVSNPPYVAQNDPHLTQGDCRFEPLLALTPGGDGLSALRQIATDAFGFLTKGGWLLLEHGHDQGEAVRFFMQSAGYIDISTARDLAGIERVCKAMRPEEL